MTPDLTAQIACVERELRRRQKELPYAPTRP